MSFTTWESLLNDGQYNQLNLGSALSNTTSLTDVSAGGNQAGEALLLPANYFAPGVQLRLRAAGIASTTGTPNLTLGVYFGGVAGTPLATATFAASANMSNNVWMMSAEIRCDAVGTSATLRTLGSVSGLSTSIAMLPASSSTGNSQTIASGGSGILTVGAQWGAAAVGNSLQVVQFLVEQLN